MALFVGMDLSGPSNSSDTAVTCFREREGGLDLIHWEQGLDDHRVVALFRHYDAGESLVVGLDAPLSYNPGGGDRDSDRELRQLLVSRGMRAGSVMTPTMTRMAYLTLRGMAIARILSIVVPHADILEVHPGGTMALHGAPVASVTSMKQSVAARAGLVQWFEENGMERCGHALDSDHMVAAMACAFGAWKWKQNVSKWVYRGEPPLHPYDYVC